MTDSTDHVGREPNGKTSCVRPRIPHSTVDAVQDFRRLLKTERVKIDYEVGYMKPPKKMRFKPGVSGNPSGARKPVRGLDVRALVQDAFLAEVPVREAGQKPKRDPKVVALVKLKLKEAVTDIKAFREVMRLAERLDVFRVVREPKRDYSQMTPQQREKAITAYHLMYEAGLVKDAKPKKGS